ncbi:MAG: alpha/beta fold hydrolase [Kangiellaceae bacterium]|nr:alpha/beta fold hydrolase [Kangiellaceae bacterium]
MPHITTVDYKAPFWCRNKHTQSLLATFKLRKSFVKKRAQALITHSKEVIIECSDGVKLQSFYTANTDSKAPLVILIHGWEGSHESLYLLSTAHSLYQAGYHVVRLNLRDHGDSHHLNPELFHSNRLDEVVDAVQQIQATYQPQKMFLCGFSLGGNFALRVAHQAPQRDIKLEKVIAICPALDPADILVKLENSLSIYIKYFMLKWRRSLRKKQQHFPELYDFDNDLQSDSMRQLTWKLIQHYGDYEDINDYFSGYNITGNRLLNMQTPCEILVAKDDPIIDYSAIHTLPDHENLKLYASEHGGHCGFIKNIKLHSWLDEFILQNINV